MRDFEIHRRIQCWDDFRPYGVVLLTGEACGLCMRGLFDLTAEGKRLVERFLGRTVEIKDQSNWNGGSKHDPHVASVMLPYELLTSLAAFVLAVTDKCGVVITKSDGVYEYTGTLDEWAERDIRRYVRRASSPVSDDRNVHQMSGRLA